MLELEEATLKYLDGSFEIITYGTFVRCAVTAETIPLEELSYWNVERQEAYKDCQTAFDKEYQLNSEKLGSPKKHWL